MIRHLCIQSFSFSKIGKAGVIVHRLDSGRERGTCSAYFNPDPEVEAQNKR
jgi:hypothetical protein